MNWKKTPASRQRSTYVSGTNLVLVNKVLLECSHPHSLVHCLLLLSHCDGGAEQWDKDLMTHKRKIFTHWPCRQNVCRVSWAQPGLDSSSPLSSAALPCCCLHNNLARDLRQETGSRMTKAWLNPGQVPLNPLSDQTSSWGLVFGLPSLILGRTLLLHQFSENSPTLDGSF